MKTQQSVSRLLIGRLLVAALLIWSLTPAFGHFPQLINAQLADSRMIADHGHSHDDGLDQFWAYHGHGHDAVDHDHSQFMMPVTIAGRAHPSPAGSVATGRDDMHGNNPTPPRRPPRA